MREGGHRLPRFARTFPDQMRANEMLPLCRESVSVQAARYRFPEKSPLLASCDETPQSFQRCRVRASQVVRCRQSTDFVGSRIVEVKPDEIARVEIDHTISRSRSSLINFVESTPPLRCLRCARNARVKRGEAKNGFTGEGRAGTIFAINRPLSVTFTSPAAACRTHAPVAL